MLTKRPFKIIIAGGGITGLTLANMLDRFDIDYVLLEAYKDIHPPKGAAIGIMPNGSFILDQLGFYETVRETAQDAEVEISRIRDANGKPLSSLEYLRYHQEIRYACQ
jgi:2-polyprenyl-6-methoxyphenol hydroxylase-like FAD-dependent oxidoreductase